MKDQMLLAICVTLIIFQGNAQQTLFEIKRALSFQCSKVKIQTVLLENLHNIGTQIPDKKCFVCTSFPNFIILVVSSAKMTLYNLFSHFSILIQLPLELHRYIKKPLIPNKANIGRIILTFTLKITAVLLIVNAVNLLLQECTGYSNKYVLNFATKEMH